MSFVALNLKVSNQIIPVRVEKYCPFLFCSEENILRPSETTNESEQVPASLLEQERQVLCLIANRYTRRPETTKAALKWRHGFNSISLTFLSQPWHALMDPTKAISSPFWQSSLLIFCVFMFYARRCFFMRLTNTYYSIPALQHIHCKDPNTWYMIHVSHTSKRNWTLKQEHILPSQMCFSFKIVI